MKKRICLLFLLVLVITCASFAEKLTIWTTNGYYWQSLSYEEKYQFAHGILVGVGLTTLMDDSEGSGVISTMFKMFAPASPEDLLLFLDAFYMDKANMKVKLHLAVCNFR